MKANDILMGRLAELVVVMRSADLEPTLIGGLAVYLRRYDLRRPLDVRDPGYLASVPRPTEDIDLAVVYLPGAEKRAANALRCLGLEPASSNPWSFVGDGLKVDLVPCLDKWTKSTSFDVEEGRKGRPLEPNRVSQERITSEVSVGVCDRAMLLLQKGLAWRDRYASRDLADIASLAISNLVERGQMTLHLEGLLASLPDRFTEVIRVVATRFEDPDQPGPLAFYYSVEDTLRQRLVGLTEEDEEAIREIASVAVRQVLRPWC